MTECIARLIEAIVGVAAKVVGVHIPDREAESVCVAGVAALHVAALTTPSHPSDDGAQRTITDRSAKDGAKFYRVEIANP